MGSVTQVNRQPLVSSTSIPASQPGSDVKTPSAASVTPMPGIRSLNQPARNSPPLSPLDFRKMLSEADQHGKLYVKREFDEHSIALTKSHFTAISDAEDNASKHFHRHRSTPDHREGHAKFRLERAEALQNHEDVSTKSSYKAISDVRINGDGSTEGYDGTSAMEKILPPGSSFRSLLEPATGGIRDIRTGLHAELKKKSWEKVCYLTFPGTGTVSTHGAQWKTNIRQFLGIGGVPQAYLDAVKLAQEIKENLPTGVELQLDGHSMGGGIATYVALKLGLRAATLNAALLGPACMKDLKKSGCLTPDRVEKIHHVRVEGDPVTSHTVSKVLTLAANFFSPFALRRAPRLLGVVHEIRRGSENYPTGNAISRHTSDGFLRAYSEKKVSGAVPIKSGNTAMPSAADTAELEAMLAAVEAKR